MRQQFLKLLSLLFVLFALSAATASPVTQADVVGAKSTPLTSDEVATLTLDPALLVGLENLAPLAPMSPVGISMMNEIEPNGTYTTSNTIMGDAAVIEGNISPNADVDYYAFTAQAGDKLYAAVMTSFSAGNSTDSQLRVFDTDGTTLIEFDDDDGSLAGLSSTIAGATLASGGTYYLEVKDFAVGGQIRPYYLYFRLQRGAPTPEVEANDTPATANPLTASGWITGTRNPALATEQDWFSFTANAGDTVFLSLDLDPERDNVQWNGRLGIALFGDVNNQILVVNDGSTGSVANPLSEAFFLTVKDAGTYFAFVDSATAAVGGPTATYHLSVSVFPAVDEGVNCTTYTSTDVPVAIGPATGMVSSTITVPGNPRIADLDVSIQLNHTVMSQIDAHLRSPAGNNNGLFTDIGAAAAGGQTQMDITIDDEAAIPFTFTVLRPLVLKPENAYRLDWFDGEDAGGVWTLDLYDDINDANGGNLTGWSIRICEPEPLLACPVGTIATTIYSSDFESDDGGFTHSGTADEWERGLPATVATTTANPIAAFNTCNSGVSCWKTDLDNTYDVSSSQNLLSPDINLTTAGLVGPVYLTWAQRYQIESATFEHAWVDVQQDGGGSPTRLWEWRDATMTNGVGNPTTNIGESSGWGVYTHDISSYMGQNVEVQFHLDSDTTINFGGLAIDDVAVTACMPSPASIEFTKTVGTDPTTCATGNDFALPATGGDVTYCYTVENTGTVTLTNHSLVDDQLGTLLNNFSFALAPSESIAITETVLITQTVVNSATWTADNGTFTVADSDTATVTVPIANPSIELVKTVGTDPTTCASGDNITLPATGGEVTYCFEVTNTGDITLTHHTLMDSHLGSILNSSAHDLAPGGSTFITATATITQTTVNTATWEAFIDGSPVPISATDDDSATVTVPTANPSITVDKTVGLDPVVCATTDSANLPLGGGEVTYCFEVTNTGDITLTHHTITDSHLGSIVSGMAYDLAPGATVFITATAEVTQTTVNTAVWEAYIDGSPVPISATDDDTATVTVAGLVTGVELSADDAQSGAVGTVVTYTVSITNTGNASNGFLLELLSSNWATVLVTDTIILDAGASTTFEVAVTVPVTAADGEMDTAVIQATAGVGRFAGGGSVDAVSLTTTAVANPTYGVQLSADDAQSGDAGTTITYTLHLTNTGDVADTFALSVAGVWTADLSTSSITIGAGESEQFTVVVSIPSNATNGQNDVATVTATSQTDGSATATAQLTTTAVVVSPANPVIYLPIVMRP